MASCPSRIHHQLVSFFVSNPCHHALPNASAFIRGTALLPNHDVLPTADASTECFEENLLPNGVLLPNSAHMSVSSLYQFLVLTPTYQPNSPSPSFLLSRSLTSGARLSVSPPTSSSSPASHLATAAGRFPPHPPLPLPSSLPSRSTKAPASLPLLYSFPFILIKAPSVDFLETTGALHGIDGQWPGRRPTPPLPPSRSMKPTRGPFRLPFPPIEPPHPLLTPKRAAARESRLCAIAGRPEPLVAGEHLLGLLASSLASRSTRTRIPHPELLLPRRNELHSRRHRSSAAGVDLLRCCFPVAQSISNSSPCGEQTFPRHLCLLTRAVALAATCRSTVVHPHGAQCAGRRPFHLHMLVVSFTIFPASRRARPRPKPWPLARDRANSCELRRRLRQVPLPRRRASPAGHRGHLIGNQWP
jgi:hypothetical protein